MQCLTRIEVVVGGVLPSAGDVSKTPPIYSPDTLQGSMIQSTTAINQCQQVLEIRELSSRRCGGISKLRLLEGLKDSHTHGHASAEAPRPFSLVLVYTHRLHTDQITIIREGDRARSGANPSLLQEFNRLDFAESQPCLLIMGLIGIPTIVSPDLLVTLAR